MSGARELLDLIIEKAPKLRDAGVNRVSIEGASFSLDGRVTADEEQVDEATDYDLNPLDDPETFGMARLKSRKIPGRPAGAES